MVYADLHIHTVASDGSMNPATILEQARQVGLQALSFTDHESVAAYHQFYDYARKLDINLLPGIEMVASYSGQEIHLLGYNFNPYSEILLNRLQQICQERNAIAKKVIHLLQKNSFNVSWEQAEALIPPGGVLGKNHILQVLHQAGYIQSKEQTVAFLRQYINPGGLVYIPYEGNPLTEAIALIHAAEGIAVLAHPGLVKDQSLIEAMLAEGIDGLEVFYYYLGNKRDDYIRYYFSLAQENGLLITGGSDFHGTYTPVKIGAMGLTAGQMEQFISNNNCRP